MDFFQICEKDCVVVNVDKGRVTTPDALIIIIKTTSTTKFIGSPVSTPLTQFIYQRQQQLCIYEQQ